MNNNRGFTLIELMIATVVILIVSLGFFAWSSTVIHRNVAMSKNNTAFSMAMDIGDRLQRLSDNALIQPKAGNNKFVGFNASGSLRRCVGGVPSGAIAINEVGMSEYTNPYNGTNLYLYDQNGCTNANPYCLSGGLITDAANANIDHPNSVASAAYDNIRPVRFIDNTTFYGVWSVAYIPCNASNTKTRKIFITVYWIDPEPTGATPGTLTAGMIKNVSITVDKVIGVE